MKSLYRNLRSAFDLGRTIIQSSHPRSRNRLNLTAPFGRGDQGSDLGGAKETGGQSNNSRRGSSSQVVNWLICSIQSPKDAKWIWTRSDGTGVAATATTAGARGAWQCRQTAEPAAGIQYTGRELRAKIATKVVLRDHDARFDLNLGLRLIQDRHQLPNCFDVLLHVCDN